MEARIQCIPLTMSFILSFWPRWDMPWHPVSQCLFLLMLIYYDLVNYTGSIGFGDSSIEELEGQIGIKDVQDCYVSPN